MPHDRDVDPEEFFDHRRDFHAALYLDGFGAAFLYQPPRVPQGFRGVELV